jgi:hypothetical protein
MGEPEELSGRKQSAVEMSVLALLVVVFLAVSLARQRHLLAEDPRQSIGIIVAAGLTLVMYSFLYRDNPLFKIAENLYVGVSLGYGAILTWRQALRPDVYDPFFGAPTWSAFSVAALHRTVPIILGILLMTRLSRKHGWLSRYSYALMIGWGAGVSIPIATHSYILQQLNAAVAPFQDAAGNQAASAATFSGPWLWHVALPIFGAVVVMAGTVAVLFYFFFSIEHKRGGSALSKLGIWFLMISFGASFGYTVMARVSLLIGRVQFLLFDWLKLPK